MQREKIICIYRNLLWDEEDDCEYYGKAKVYISASANYTYDSEAGSFKVNKKTFGVGEIFYLQIGEQIIEDCLPVHIGDKVWLLMVEHEFETNYIKSPHIDTRMITTWQQIADYFNERGVFRLQIFDYTKKCPQIILDELKLEQVYKNRSDAKEALEEINRFSDSAKNHKLSYIHTSQGIFY